MQLVGVTNSPYFRRTAISLELLGVPFEVTALSPFLDVQALADLNPVMKVPTLVCDNGEQIMDSSLIIQFAEASLANGRSLWPDQPRVRQSDFRAVSLAMAALEKCLQIIYETMLRPPESRHAPWLERIEGQCQAAFTLLNQCVLDNADRYARGDCQAAITAAVAWSFGSQVLAGTVPSARCEALARLGSQLETLPQFRQHAPQAPAAE